MKARLNLTVEQEILNKAKEYAHQQKTSISSLVEEYLNSISKPRERSSLTKLIDSLPKSGMFKEDDIDFKKEYYEAKGKKYGL